jgi:hypothetical protein
MNGKGKLCYANGEIYNGNMRNNKRNGFGVIVNIDGSGYEGEWLNNKGHGRGIEMNAKSDVNGGIYIGDF